MVKAFVYTNCWKCNDPLTVPRSEEYNSVLCDECNEKLLDERNYDIQNEQLDSRKTRREARPNSVFGWARQHDMSWPRFEKSSTSDGDYI